MAFGFFKKKSDGEGPAGPQSETTEAGAAEAGESGGGAVQPNPAKARVFFDRALAVHDSTNYEYAMTLWLQGMRLDPTSVEALQNFSRSASEFLNSAARPKGPTRDQQAAVSGRTTVDKYLSTLLMWGTKPLDWSLGLKCFELAVKIEAKEPAYWIGKRVLGIAGEDRKAKKDSFVQIMNLFSQLQAFDQAVIAGEIACRLDPTDARLAGEVKNMSAQATMKASGFNEGQAVEAGYFRRNVKDLESQRAKEAEERIVKTEDDLNSSIERSLKDYQARPTDLAAIQKVSRLLLERGTPQDEKKAYEILMKGFADTQNYRFKVGAGEINLRVARRQVRAIKEEAAANPDDKAKRDQAAKVERQLMELEVKEYQDRVANTPTDLVLRYELARRLLDLGQNEPAIEHFQAARGSPSIAVQVLSGLATAFTRLGWLDEAESSYREAIAAHPVTTDELAAELRYGLMDTLYRKAEDARNLPLAEEAFKLASGIAVQRIGFRDIRNKRQQLQDLVKALREAK